MHDYKLEAATQQVQFDKIRKEMDTLLKECRDASVGVFSANYTLPI